MPIREPTSEEIHVWINEAYRRPKGYAPMANDGFRFTRWNMEVAYMAGWDAAIKECTRNKQDDA